MKTSNAIAVVDAAVAHGACRYYQGVHLDPTYKWRANYKRADDRTLFLEFLHQLLLYDLLLLDSSCVSQMIPDELLVFFTEIQKIAGVNLIHRTHLAPYSASELGGIARAICRLVSGAAEDSAKREGLLSSKIPWAYTDGHHDYDMFSRVAIEEDLDPKLIPFTLYSFRGLCYAGFANHHVKSEESPAVYAASPGRIAALQKIISSKDLKKMDFAGRGYRDLVNYLSLPKGGYDFSNYTSFYPHEVSRLAITTERMSPAESLNFALSQRQTKPGLRIRKEWAERIWANSQSPAIGPNHGLQQEMSNISAGGNVTQIIYASPVD